MASALATRGTLTSSRKRTDAKRRWLAKGGAHGRHATAKTRAVAEQEQPKGCRPCWDGILAAASGIQTSELPCELHPIRLMGLSLVLLGAVGVFGSRHRPGQNTMAKADESGRPRRSELRSVSRPCSTT